MHKSLFHLLFVATLLLSGISLAQNQPATNAPTPPPPPAWYNDLEALTYEKDGNKLPYRFLKPKKIEEGKTYPLVIFLHGAGERGDDNTAQLKHSVGDIIRLASDKYPFFMIVPQCPKNKRWVEVDWGALSHTMPATPSDPLKLAFELIDKAAKDFPIDAKRIYVVGLSMGGFGTWDCIQRYPDKFAAAVPVCGGGDTAEAPKLVSVPIWAFHGDADNTVKTSRSRDMIEAITKAGGTPKYTEYPGVGHGSWGKAFNNQETIDWLFAQSKK